MPVTQKDIARKLNLSIMTISRALKGHPDINIETRKLVEKTAREMNYSVNLVARSLVQKRTNTIGVVVPDISEPFYAEIVRGVESVLRRYHYNILLADSDNDDNLELEALRTLLEKRVDGLIFCATEKSSEYIHILENISIPYVLINNNPVGLECDSIYIDRGLGARNALLHLISSGFEKLFYFYSFQHMEQSRKSIQGCFEALKEANAPREMLQLLFCETHELETYYKMALDNIHYQNQRIGLFVWDDEMAIGVYRAVVEKGLAIPDQVGIIGFDDIKISSYLPKALTTIHYPKTEMGQKSAERVIQRLTSEEPLAIKNIMLDLQLIKRETT
ncbi:MAG TPA: LacI family DNA-binding transcriptional regulator [bacterium]|nr:LacI family DNA-binding transcriptional regulator [bacterium]HPN44390.1 LacI family DNA-binding transcriptional regulator [bacterium]